jgi:putative transposase
VTERLGRLDFTYKRCPIYFVTACTANRRQLLHNCATHDTFKKFAASAAAYDAWVGRYVLMPDHCHLFVALDDEQLSLSQWMKSMKGVLSALWRSAGIMPPFWQKGFFDHVLRSDESYSGKWEYVCENPVRAGLVAHATDWPFAGEVNDLEF